MSLIFVHDDEKLTIIMTINFLIQEQIEHALLKYAFYTANYILLYFKVTNVLNRTTNYMY